MIQLESYQTPEVIEDTKKDFVAFGTNNGFYDELIDVYLNSPTSHSSITGIVNQIVGKGIHAHNASMKPNEFANFKSLVKQKDLKKIALDYKLLGEASIQVSYLQKKVVKVSHFNRETLRAEKCDDKGAINAYYYHPKWSEYQDGDKLTRIPVFGSGSKNEIYIIRRHIPSMHYYSVPDYIGSLNYGRLECSISEFLCNEVENSFSGSKLVSMANGTPSVEKMRQIKAEITDKLTGVHGEKVIVSFSDSVENRTTIEDISAPNSADVYQYIAEECSRKLMIGHRITSPLLVGIRDSGNSLGSNSEEIQNAHNLFENLVIRPYQDDIIEAIDDILAINGISLDLYVKTLTPIEFTNTENAVTKEQIEEETGQELSSEKDFEDQQMFEQIQDLGDNEKTLLDFGYVLIDEREVDHDQEQNLDDQVKLASVPKGRADVKSELDGETESGEKYLIRYQYTPLVYTPKSREFCKLMVKAKRVYRKEDLDRDFKGNADFNAKNESSYNLFKHKGGKYCKHSFLRKTYLLTDGKIDPNNPNAAKSLIYKTEIAKKGIPTPTEDQEPEIVRQKPNETPSRGAKI